MNRLELATPLCLSMVEIIVGISGAGKRFGSPSKRLCHVRLHTTIQSAIGKHNAGIVGHKAQKIDGGAATLGNNASTETVIRLLNEALASEIICILRYKRHYFMTARISSRHVKAMLLQHVTEARAHADQLAERIVQLGGQPVLSLERLLNRSHAEHVEGDSVVEMMTADLIAERAAVESYRDMIASVGPDDLTTRQVLEQIVAQEEEHAGNLASLLRDQC